MSACPEALYGQHGEPNTSGKCPYCGAHLGGRWRPGRSRNSLTDDELDQTSWSARAPHISKTEPETFIDDQDPIRSYDDEEY